MSKQSKSLLNLTKLTYDFYINSEAIQLSFDNTATVGQAINQLSQLYNIQESQMKLYLAKKNGEPKTSLPAFESGRLLKDTYSSEFALGVNIYNNILSSRPPQYVESNDKPKGSRLLSWLGCQ